MKSAWIVPAVAVAAVLGFFAQRWIGGGAGLTPDTVMPPLAGETPRDGTTPVALPGSAAYEEGDEGTPVETSKPPLVIPETLPTFSLADREGKQRTLQDWAGRPLLVNYWATWCAPCRREIPLLNELRAESQGQKLEVIGVAVDFREDVLQYASETPIDYPLLIGEDDGLKAVEAMGMQPAFPFTVFADSKQRIVTVKVGELHRDEAEMIIGKLKDIDSGALPIARARTEIDAGLKELAARRASDKAAAPATPQPAG